MNLQKNNTNYLTVKEQRVYGSYMGNYLPLLRCTLKGFERNYQIGILTNQINRQVRFNSYHVVQSSQTSLFESINPWFITGFVEAEGSFIINITKNNKTKTGWRVQVEFKIGLHKKDLNLLNGIQKFFGVGAVYNQAEDAVQLIVQSAKELIVIINHFDKYPPITKKKWGDFQLFKQVVYMMLNKEHLTIQGLDKIVSIKASLNLGLSAKLKTAFPSIIPATRNLDGRLICTIPDPFWIAGFTSASLRARNIFYAREVGLILLEIRNPLRILSDISAVKKGMKQFSTRVKANTNNSLSLVVWGTNLTSTVGVGRFSKQVRDMIQLPPYQKSVIIGLILSDGWLRFPSKTSKSANLGLKQSVAHSDYVWFVFSLLSHYCDNLPLYRLEKRGEKSHLSVEIVTRALPCFNELYFLFYVNKVKVIPENIYDLLTPVALAHLILGDGSAQRHGLILCTDSFTIPRSCSSDECIND